MLRQILFQTSKTLEKYLSILIICHKLKKIKIMWHLEVWVEDGQQDFKNLPKPSIIKFKDHFNHKSEKLIIRIQNHHRKIYSLASINKPKWIKPWTSTKTSTHLALTLDHQGLTDLVKILDIKCPLKRGERLEIHIYHRLQTFIISNIQPI